MKWLRSVGSVHQHWKTQQLVAFYSDDRDPSIRRSLEAELEGRPTGVAEVLAACREATDRHNRMIDGATQRHGAVAGEKA